MKKGVNVRVLMSATQNGQRFTFAMRYNVINFDSAMVFAEIEFGDFEGFQLEECK